MAEITAAMVKELRERTDAPMMECKKALTEAQGDIAKAEELLRIKLGNKAAKAASRVTAEGMVAAFQAPGLASLVEINCETDFVAKNADFIGFANAVARLVAEQAPASVEALYALTLGGKTVDEVRRELVGKIGENLSVRRFNRYATAGTSDHTALYLHGTRIGVLVRYQGGNEQVGKDVAMHIAASKPLAVSKEQVSAEHVARERAVAEGRARESGKPAELQAKMVMGAVNKYLAEVALLSQPFVKDPDQTVEKMLQGHQAKVVDFTLFVVGEGLEKRSDNFAEEVAAQVAASRQAA